MARTGPEDREQEYVPPQDAQEKGFWGVAVSEYPNEMYTASEIVKRAPGGVVGTDPAEAEKAPSRAKASDVEESSSSDDSTESKSETARKPTPAPKS